ncbi:MAG: c-type cytochrome [Burkholderiaceae bacterium]
MNTHHRMTALIASALLGAAVALAMTPSAHAQMAQMPQPQHPHMQQPMQQQMQQRVQQRESAARVDAGQRAYETHCASCHGMGGRGDGPMKPFLTVAPSDLTTIAKRNGGAFPEQLVWEMIDGRSSVSIGPHGSREMPVWGQEFRDQAKRRGDQNPEWSARNRILALLAYLNGMQQK